MVSYSLFITQKGGNKVIFLGHGLVPDSSDVIPSLHFFFIVVDEDEMLLCTVHAVRHYVRKQQHLKPLCKHLFCLSGPCERDVQESILSIYLGRFPQFGG